MRSVVKQLFNSILLPGFVFQSIVLAGGYGTGRELVEFFLKAGPATGLLGLITSGIIWSIISALTFEFARATQSYDYRTFFKHLLGRYWFCFEIAYCGIMLIVLAVVAATSGSLLSQLFNLPYLIGVTALLTYISVMVFKGSSAIEKMLSVWSVLLYLVYIIFIGLSVQYFGDDITLTITQAASPNIKQGLYDGVRYAAYNLGLIPAVLFVARHFSSRTQAITAGILTGPIAIIPAVMFYFSMLGHYPNIIGETLPSEYILSAINQNWLTISYNLILFGTLIETATGLIHALNERIAQQFKEQAIDMWRGVRVVVTLVLFTITLLLARFGLNTLIAKGYGTLTWAVVVVYIIPILWLFLRKAQHAISMVKTE